MTRPSLRAAAVMAAVSALLLSGCAPSDGPAATSQGATAAPKPTPMFASDEEALKAATEVYRKLITTELGMYPSGTLDRSKLEPFATEKYVARSVVRFQAFIDRGAHATGNGKVSGSSLQSVRPAAGATEVTIYVCLDVSAFRILDASGADVTPTSRNDLLSSVVTLHEGPDGKLRVDTAEPWSGQSVC